MERKAEGVDSVQLPGVGLENDGPEGGERKDGEPDGGDQADSWRGMFFDLAKIAALAVVISLFSRTFLFQPFSIPSGSMKPTLLVGDYLVVTKFNYGFSHYAFPFQFRLFSGRLFSRDPERGDVVVFDRGGVDYIKRVIGLPGDRIQMRHGRLFINEKQAPLRLTPKPFVTTDRYGMVREVRRYEETLPNGVKYATLDLQQNNISDDTQVYVVPPGHFFMMGDNRDNSADSRFKEPIGFVPRENLIGKAQYIYYSRQSKRRMRSPRKGDGRVRWNRLLMKIR